MTIKSSYLSVRVPDDVKLNFYDKAKQFGTPSEVLREMVDAFIEDRVLIKHPKTPSKKERLYVSRK